jgi:hypothetical protein
MKPYPSLLLLFALASGAGKADPPAIEPKAERILRDACHYLADAPFFIASGELWRERVVESGQKLEFGRTIEFHVRRPDRLHVEIKSNFSNRGFWFDGKTFAVLDRKRNFFGSAELPGHLDSALDRAHDEFGVDLPLADIASAEPYDDLTSKVQRGSYLGINPVLGVDCHHLAFTQENIDWQIWITEGPQPVIRKMILTHKLKPGAPEFTAILTKWDFTTRIADSDFQFEPPNGALKIEMEKVTKKNSSKPGKETVLEPHKEEK